MIAAQSMFTFDLVWFYMGLGAALVLCTDSLRSDLTVSWRVPV